MAPRPGSASPVPNKSSTMAGVDTLPSQDQSPCPIVLNIDGPLAKRGSIDYTRVSPSYSSTSPLYVSVSPDNISTTSTGNSSGDSGLDLEFQHLAIQQNFQQNFQPIKPVFGMPNTGMPITSGYPQQLIPYNNQVMYTAVTYPTAQFGTTPISGVSAPVYAQPTNPAPQQIPYCIHNYPVQVPLAAANQQANGMTMHQSSGLSKSEEVWNTSAVQYVPGAAVSIPRPQTSGNHPPPQYIYVFDGRSDPNTQRPQAYLQNCCMTSEMTPARYYTSSQTVAGCDTVPIGSYPDSGYHHGGVRQPEMILTADSVAPPPSVIQAQQYVSQAPALAGCYIAPPSMQAPVPNYVYANSGVHTSPQYMQASAESCLTGLAQGTIASSSGCSVNARSNPLMNSANMDVVWHSSFNDLFRIFTPHQWCLSPTAQVLNEGEFKCFNDSAKVRFLCQKCCNAWTSMKGRVVFWYKFDPQTLRGFVFFKLFGQKCQKCLPEEFEHAMWYPEEVTKVITNIHQKVGQTLYGFPASAVRADRRPGKPRTQHNASLCQACANGICREIGGVSKALGGVSGGKVGFVNKLEATASEA